jgi:5'-nucleotidase
MIILLSNDDGIDSTGLKTLEEVFADHEVWTVAPDGDRSGRSHSITLSEPVKMRQIGEQRFACGGSPADCIMLAFLGAIPVTPDIVVSGINHGPNLGTDIIYSGTAAAARQGALMGHPSIAVSIAAFSSPLNFYPGAKFVAANLEIFNNLWNPEHFININFPNVEDGTEMEVVVTHPARRFYRDELRSYTAPNKDIYYFLHGSLIEGGEDPESDWGVIKAGKLSVSPVYLHPVIHRMDDVYRKTNYRKPEEA